MKEGLECGERGAREGLECGGRWERGYSVVTINVDIHYIVVTLSFADKSYTRETERHD